MHCKSDIISSCFQWSGCWSNSGLAKKRMGIEVLWPVGSMVACYRQLLAYFYEKTTTGTRSVCLIAMNSNGKRFFKRTRNVMFSVHIIHSDS